VFEGGLEIAAIGKGFTFNAHVATEVLKFGPDLLQLGSESECLGREMAFEKVGAVRLTNIQFIQSGIRD
jgi:hypothetical protein